jgi:hypothetical protein
LTFAGFWLFAASCYGEITVASSLEWLTVSSEIVATGEVLSVEKVKGQYAVIYENYVIKLSENMKGVNGKKIIRFTIRTFSTEPVFGKTVNISDEVMVFLSHTETEEFLKDKLVPTNDSFPLSIINLRNPSKYIIDMNFKVLSDKAEIIKTSKETQKKLIEYKKRHSVTNIKGFYLKVPTDSEAHRSLFGGSSSFLRVPNFMAPDSKESIHKWHENSSKPDEPQRYSYNLSGKVLDEKSQLMAKTTVCFVPSERPINGRIPCTKTDSKGKFDFTVKDISDKYRVCASTSESIFVLVGDKHRVICTKKMLFGAQDEIRNVTLKFKASGNE